MSVEFVVSAYNSSQFPTDGLAEVAFIGRSNVGKSSMLNTLLQRAGKRISNNKAVNRKGLAKISQTPGRTQAVNFFRVEGQLYFVDLPGYGYAKAPRQEIDRWRRLAENYLQDRAPLRLVVLIIDIRHGPTVLDHQMVDWLKFNELPFCVAASKSDKLKPVARQRSIRSIAEGFFPLVPFSAVNGEGVQQLWKAIKTATAE